MSALSPENSTAGSALNETYLCWLSCLDLRLLNMHVTVAQLWVLKNLQRHRGLQPFYFSAAAGLLLPVE